MARGDLIFININVKGYDKEVGVRYALSENEIVVEVRQPGTHKMHRLCKTLFKPIVVHESEVKLLVDYIAITLKKSSSDKWDQVGYDIENFAVPANIAGLRSNFLKSEEEKNLQVKPAETSKAEGKENLDRGNVESAVEESTLTEEEKEALARKQEEEAIEALINKQKTAYQMSFLQLESEVFLIH